MELKNLRGCIIGLVYDKYKEEKMTGLVKDIVTKKTLASLKMVGLAESLVDEDISSLSRGEQNKVGLASKLLDDVIVLKDFSVGLTKKELTFYKRLFKKISSYNKKIILIDKNAELFIDLVDNIYVIDEDILYETNDIYDAKLYDYIDKPFLVEFTKLSEDYGVKLNHYYELDELLKAIYRIKS